MDINSAKERCYRLIDANKAIVEETRKIRHYQNSPVCTNFINTVQRYVGDTLWGFVNQLSNAATVDADWINNNIERFEKQTEGHRNTLKMLKEMPTWSIH